MGAKYKYGVGSVNDDPHAASTRAAYLKLRLLHAKSVGITEILIKGKKVRV